MKKIFEFEDYKAFTRSWIQGQTGAGRGQSRKIAQHLKIHSTMMSHILGGKQHFSEDQAILLAEYMGLTELETQYFLELIRLARAATQKLQNRIKRRLEELRDKAHQIKNRILDHQRLSPEASARFYSNWFYSAIRLMSDIPEFQSREQLIKALGIPREVAHDAITFLLENGLCREQDGKILIGPSRTHLPADSPHIWTMHKNWRLKAIERHARVDHSELFYSAPMSIAAADVMKIRELVVQLIENVTRIAAGSKAEQMVALNIDWYRVVQPSAVNPRSRS